MNVINVHGEKVKIVLCHLILQSCRGSRDSVVGMQNRLRAGMFGHRIQSV